MQKDFAGSTYSQQAARIEATWAVGKLKVVPGDILLDLVAKNYDVRFKKEQDSAKLASLMTEQDIPEEI